jgi:plasmid replication initiation protein
MSRIKDFGRQFDLFVPFVADLPLRDQRETMERPFFSLGKRKRIKPITYTSPDGEIYVKITADAEYGMATIWDADILIWAASVLCDMKKKGRNDIPRTLHFQPYDLLKTIGRDTGGREYKLLREALTRLQSTTIVTNIRAETGKKKHRQFSWVEGISDLTDESGLHSLGMTFTLADWFYEGVLAEGSVLAIDPEYFTIKGGRERWLYRVARKHAGGNPSSGHSEKGEEGGFAIALPTLFEKSGAEGTYRRFKFEILKIAHENTLPSFTLQVEHKQGREPVLRMIRREGSGSEISSPLAPHLAKMAVKNASPPVKPASFMPLFESSASSFAPSGEERAKQSTILSDAFLKRLRSEFKGWDMYTLKAEFDAWIAEDKSRTPHAYESAFYGFVKRFVRQA